MKRKLRDDITKGEIFTSSGKISNALDCYEQINYRFGSEKWAKLHTNSPVSRMIPLWTTTEEINRPKLPYEYDPLGGCQKDRQFMAFRADVVGARAFGHWCEACCKVQGPGKGGMDSGKKEGKSMVFGVSACTSAWPKWKEIQVSRCDASGVGARRKLAQDRGHDIAMNAQVGQFCAAETRTDGDDRFAVGVFVDAGHSEGSPSPIIKRITTTSEVIDGKRFYKGDYVLKAWACTAT